MKLSFFKDTTSVPTSVGIPPFLRESSLTHFLSHSLKIPLLCAITLALFIASCGTTEESFKKGPFKPDTKKTKKAATLSKSFIQTLNETRSELDDVFAGKNPVPHYFAQKDSSSTPPVGNPFTGFRVQILSTRNVAIADSTADEFRKWAAKHIVGYFPQVYVTFDQPYYKVHVGNFQFYQRAVKFTQLVKTKYPAAWVVHDRINPKAVPEGEIRLVQTEVSNASSKQNQN